MRRLPRVFAVLASFAAQIAASSFMGGPGGTPAGGSGGPAGMRPEVLTKERRGGPRANEGMSLIRIELDPGSDTMANTTAAGRSLYVESGHVRFRLTGGVGTLTTLSSPGSNGPLTTGTWVDLGPGDHVFRNAGASYEYRNESDQVAVVYVTGYLDVTIEGCGGGCS
jgi:hypothetical protein